MTEQTSASKREPGYYHVKLNLNEWTIRYWDGDNWRISEYYERDTFFNYAEIDERRIERTSPQQQPDVCPTCGNLKPDGKYCSNSFHLMPDELSKAQAGSWRRDQPGRK